MALSRSPLLPLGASALALALVGCAPIPDLGTRPVPRAPASVESGRSLPATPTAAWPGDGWWTGYGDPQLTALIEEGLSNSPDVAIAAARLRAASGMAQQAGAPLLPSLDAEAAAGVTKQSYNNGFPEAFVPHGWLGTGRAALDLGFDLDLWGKNRAALAAATSEQRAAQIDAQQARLVLTTAIADAYADLARLHDAREIAQRALDLRLASQKLITDRQANGLETRGSQRQADATASSARASVTAADEQIALRRNQIAALIGAGPDRGLSIVRPQARALVQLGLPDDVTTDLIGRRPDIAAARERTEAAASRIKVARADFFPAVRLSALVGFQSLGYTSLFTGAGAEGGASPFIDSLFKPGSLYGNAGPAISLPIFHGGAIQGQYRGARATYDEAVASYDKTVLAAYREVADAVTSRRALDRRLVDARAALTSSEEAYGIAQKRYGGGLSTYLDVLNVEDRLLSARQSVADLHARAFALDIALIRALGGGFTVAAHTTKDAPHG
ncbi:efflux transporter outer membrane subunit [Sphingobium sufflavum]|uniref:efflux transporter outer membrane subunit n=1 Tax=Sphingobium sufflavum TaxID=1129547 RepID=UPI001F3D4253|nr:efflux transporter outer membrane subunit [Sphingobium sufflavum]MCE7795147.1 efflux transporter outer membrane subunit [Sphingobium sufflavum]